MSHWTTEEIPDQTGRVAIVTGANSGLGLETTIALAQHGAHVVMACRNTERMQRARLQVLRAVPDADLALMILDLASLAAVHDFADKFRANYDRLDLLINNAGVMAPPRRESADGFELQFAVNHLGHFALTGLLLDLLLETPGSRVVTVSSGVAFMGEIRFDDLQWEQSYSRYGAYGQSKLANVLFAQELQRRLHASGATTLSLVAHPGFADTDLQENAAEATGSRAEAFMYRVIKGAGLAQSAAQGALPQLYAATAPDARGGAFYAPHFLSMRGYPQEIDPPKAANDLETAARLWRVSEELTGVHYEALQTVPAPRDTVEALPQV
jgi:NAD(P)-dependent dehydrogenase (short-subunit alcohol dehydrogenase family)